MIFVEIPPELKVKHRKITLCMDTCFVNEIPFLNTISRHTMHRTTNQLDNRMVDFSQVCMMDNAFGKCNATGFTVGCIHCDIEFKPVMEKIKAALKIRVIHAGKGEHVPEAAWNNRVTKECCCSGFHMICRIQSAPKSLVGSIGGNKHRESQLFPSQGWCVVSLQSACDID